MTTETLKSAVKVFAIFFVLTMATLGVDFVNPPQLYAASPVTATCKKPDDGQISAEWKDGQNQTVRIDLWDLPGLAGIAQQYPAAYQHTFWNPDASTNCTQVIFQFPEMWVNYIDVVAHDENAASGLTINAAIIDGGGNTLGWSQKYIAWDSYLNSGNLTTGASCPKDDHLELKEPRADQCFVSIGGVSIKAKTNQLRFNDLDRSSNEDVIFRLMNVNAAPVLKCQLWSDANTIVRGQSTTLRWNSPYATEGWVDGVKDTTPTSGDKSIRPTASQTYSATFFDSNGQQVTCEHRVTVTEPPPTPLSCRSVTVSPVTMAKGTLISPTLNCTFNGDGAVVYKVTRPSNTPTGAPTVSAVPPNMINNLAIPADQLNEGSYPISCVPCYDAKMTNCAPVIPACATTLAVTPPEWTTNQCGDITNFSAPMQFVVTDGLFDLQTISWKITAEPTPKTTSFSLSFYPDGTSASNAITVSYPESAARRNPAVRGDYTVTLSEQNVRDIHTKLVSAATNKLHIEVRSFLADGTICDKAGVPQVYTPPPPETFDTVTVKVRDGASCVENALPSISGTLAATWPGGSKSSGAPDFTVDIPTGKTLRSTYDFSSSIYSCASCSPANASGQCQRDHNPTTLEAAIYVSQLNISSWWETIGGLAYGATMGNNLPVDGLGQPTLCKTATGGSERLCAPYGSRSSSFTQNLLGGLLMTANNLGMNDGWAAERPTTGQFAEYTGAAQSNALKKIGGSSYEYYHSLVSAKAKLTSLGAVLNAKTDLPNTGSDPKYFKTAGNLTIDPTSTINVGSGEKIIIFVKGDLIIGNDSVEPDSLKELIKVEQGGFLALFVKNGIKIKQSVGTSILAAVEPTAANGIGQTNATTVANIEGMYVADGPITIETNGASDIPDKRFIGEGSFVSAQPIVMKRSFSRDAAGVENSKILSGYSPTEVFRHRPDLVLATPPELRTHLIQYQEIN